MQCSHLHIETKKAGFIEVKSGVVVARTGMEFDRAERSYLKVKITVKQEE